MFLIVSAVVWKRFYSQPPAAVCAPHLPGEALRCE